MATSSDVLHLARGIMVTLILYLCESLVSVSRAMTALGACVAWWSLGWLVGSSSEAFYFIAYGVEVVALSLSCALLSPSRGGGSLLQAGSDYTPGDFLKSLVSRVA
ncbi:hypothetical protein PVAP13_3NG272550 [Panicum virgatum]|uniref:Uncharacterized protein n=1 Tax=Panicum virgatum TaxID=38727 RepID=A0A8T0UN39_PANVG|nr:hypothetical protein PVAP13_3NG272550 [Panicum virgatum]